MSPGPRNDLVFRVGDEAASGPGKDRFLGPTAESPKAGALSV